MSDDACQIIPALQRSHSCTYVQYIADGDLRVGLERAVKMMCHSLCLFLCRLEAQQKQALLRQQLEYLSSAPFGDSPLFRMGLKVTLIVVFPSTHQ